jgi:hypothetical protein
MFQQIIVGLIVAVAAIAVVKRYAPKSIKRAVQIGVVRMSKALGWNSLADRLVQKAEAGASCGDGCGSCGSCDQSAGEKGAPVQSVSVESLTQTLRR